MKQLFLASLLSLLLVPHFSYAAENGVKVSHHHAHTRMHVQSHSKTSVAPIDINQANETQLVSLKGIGPKKAQAIIAYRAAHGAFKSVSDLAHVKGIGVKSVARLQSKNPGRLVVNTKTKLG